MTPFEFQISLLFISLLAGVVGSLLGIGGGIIIIPALTLFFKVDIRYAIGASIVSVIATSSGAAATYVRERIANLRVAMLLEIATTLGALSGAYLAGRIANRWLYIVFALVMGYSSLIMFKTRSESHLALPVPSRWADLLQLHSRYFDSALGEEVNYRVAHTRLGLLLMYVAGIVSGLLGIGSGALKVPAMDLAMQLPIKVSAATSNLMIGVTAAASAGVYFMRGDINPFIAAPVAAGVVFGALIGSRLLGKIRSRIIRVAFAAVLLLVCAQMLWKGLWGL